ncbi:putative uncharacterized protein DDB_G0282499 isoform X1 [Bombyx mori]|uniref:Uncharacterized protein n=2 Tax=Bombyx mori TaxID=7091 RepID=A0A8R2AIH3_BOMMO|nr:putative uncharacterized protein DDB_G0282499 isoform X1 [Bombyx mori]
MSKFCQCTDPIEINFFKGTYFQKMQVMNYLILLIFICSLFKGFQCKPMTIDENSDLEESEYSNDAVDEANSDDDDTSLEDQEQSDQDKLHQPIRSEERYMENRRPAHTESDNDVFNKMESDESREHISNGRQPFTVNNQNVEYRGNEHYDSNNDKFLLSSNEKSNARKTYVKQQDDSDNYFSKKSNDAFSQDRYLNRYYEDNRLNKDKITNENRGFEILEYNRDTRSLKEENISDATKGSANSNDNCKGNEQTVIKEHVKKLSERDLKELLSSLTEDKKELLQRLIDDNSTSDGVIKREITKITAEDDSNVSSGETESNKGLGVSNNLGDNAEYPSAQDVATAKNTVDLKYFESNAGSEINDQQPLADSTKPNSENNLHSATEISLKTEIHPILDDSDTNGNKLVKNSEISEHSEPLGEFENDSQNMKPFKREIEADDEISQSLQSLEDSFPNTNIDENPLLYSEPRIRVKRTDSNQIVKKRGAGILPEGKMGYFSYKAENQDEDNDEGNEFDDESFFDNLSESSRNNVGLEYSDLKNTKNCNEKAKSYDPSNISIYNAQKETENVGSDTDTILSGMENIDDKLMLSGDSRNKRQLLNQSNKYLDKSSISDDRVEPSSEKYINSPGYHEDDAFGPLPHNSVGDLGRYKRIRRVKESHKNEDTICNI